MNKTPNLFKDRVYETVEAIPKLHVMTYSQIAAICGNPRAARQVGGLAHHGPTSLPWHRVVNKSGGLASGYYGGKIGHKKDLEAEGFEVTEDFQIDTVKYLYWPNNKPLIVIVGETASGKSSAALQIAQTYNGEIISADSWAVYKGMNIGTAKPSKEERRLVRHHLIDIVGPDQDYTAGLYQRDVHGTMNQIYTRGNIPIIVGGTGLYIDGVIYNFSFMKTSDKKIRQYYNSLSITQLIEEIEAKKFDLTGIDLRNKRRLIRVLETNGEIPKRSKLRANTLVIGMKVGRNQLRSNIEQRVETMFKMGLKKEVLHIVDKYGWDSEGMQGIGYKEFKLWHDGELSIRRTKQRIIKNTLALAKRQRTWFKKNRQIEWVATAAEAELLVEKFLDS